MKKLGISLILCFLAGMAPVIVIFAIIIGIAGMVGSDIKNMLTDSAEDPERFQELMELADMGVPSDIIMMVTTFQYENQEEVSGKPFFSNALDFMLMTEVISEKNHTCQEEIEEEDEPTYEGECDCEFEIVETEFYYHKDAILGYLGMSGDPPESLNIKNLEARLQAAANEKAMDRAVETMIDIQVNAIDDTLYREAIRRCGIEDPEKVDAIIVLHESGYYIEWFRERAAQLGIELSEGITIGGLNGVHSKIVSVLAGDTSEFTNESFGDPVAGWRGTISCEFGGYVGHTGIDFAVPIGTPVYASISGTVIIAESGSSGYGNYVVINHGGGIATLYAHCTSLAVSEGDVVTQGQVIAYSGNTGNVIPMPTPEDPTAGAHLHFEVVVNGIPKNPRGYLQ